MQESDSLQSLLPDLLSALTTDGSWSEKARSVTRLWVQCGDVDTAAVITAQSITTLHVTIALRLASHEIQTRESSIETSAAALIDERLTLQLNSQLNGDSECPASVELWPDLTAALLLTHEPSREAGRSHIDRASLIAISRQILQRATDHPALIPDAHTLEAMAEFAAGAGHEINNPLASIIGQAQLQLKSQPGIELRQALETIGAQAWRIRDMIGNAMLFARPPKLNLGQLDLVTITRETLEPMQSLAKAAGCQLILDGESVTVPLVADATQLKVLMSQLVRNSIEAIQGSQQGDRITVSVREHSHDSVSITVADNGPGITSPEVRRHLFNPFYSGRSAGRGLGFGLCLAWQIVRMHRGMIFMEDRDSPGAAIHVVLRTGSSDGSRFRNTLPFASTSVNRGEH